MIFTENRGGRMKIRERIRRLFAYYKARNFQKDIYISIYDDTWEESGNFTGFWLSDYEEYKETKELDYILLDEHRIKDGWAFRYSSNAKERN